MIFCRILNFFHFFGPNMFWFAFVQANEMSGNTKRSVPHETVHRSAYKER